MLLTTLVHRSIGRSWVTVNAVKAMKRVLQAEAERIDHG